jgi:glyoxylase-like metal-dependent hydrolase (beta-lactamase superfamily II)
MSPLDTGELIPGVFVIRDGFANSYLLESSDPGRYIAIDAGRGAPKIRGELSRLGISSDDIIVVLLTHTHMDHRGGLSVFDKAAVYAGENAKSGSESKTLAEGELTVIAGMTIRCISTPGHTDDSVCYLIDGKYLFTGDTLSLQGDEVRLFNSFFNNSDEMQKADIERLAALSGVQYVFSAHYGYTDHAVFP